MREIMSDVLLIGYWRSEGNTYAPAAAIAALGRVGEREYLLSNLLAQSRCQALPRCRSAKSTNRSQS
jgi:hypothetical protein